MGKRRRPKDDPEYIAWLDRIDNTPTEELVVYSEGQAIQKWTAARQEAEEAGYSSVKEYDAAMNKPPAVPMIISAVEAAFLLGYSNVEAYNTDVYSEAVARDQARLARLEKAAALAARFQVRAPTHGRNLRSSVKEPIPSTSSALPYILSNDSLKTTGGPKVYSRTEARSASEGLHSDASSDYNVLPTARSPPADNISPHPHPPDVTAGGSAAIPDLLSPFRFQLMLFQTRLNSATLFVARSYPTLCPRVHLIQSALARLFFEKLPVLRTLARDMPPEFAYKYASVVAVSVADVGRDYLPPLDKDDFVDIQTCLFFSRSILSSLVRVVPAYPPNPVYLRVHHLLNDTNRISEWFVLHPMQCGTCANSCKSDVVCVPLVQPLSCQFCRTSRKSCDLRAAYLFDGTRGEFYPERPQFDAALDRIRTKRTPSRPPPANSSLLYSSVQDVKPDLNLVSDSRPSELPDFYSLIPHYTTPYSHLQAMDHQCLLDLAIVQQDKLALPSDIFRRASSGAVDGRVVPELIFAAAHKVHYCTMELLFTLKSLRLSAAKASDGDGRSVEFPLVDEFLPMFEDALTEFMEDLQDWTRIQS